MRDKRIELSQNAVQHEHMTREYGQLRQMLHALVMTVEVGAAETPGNSPTAIEAGPNSVAPLAPVAVASEPKAAEDGVGAEMLRAGMMRILKKKRTPADETETVPAEGTEAPAPAE